MMDERTYLAHFGIKGQKWGVRRYQNEDGSLTSAGREHYGYGKKQAGVWTKGKNAIHRIRERKAAKKEEARKRKVESNPRLMDDATLQKKVQRMRLEQEYQKRYAELNPEKQSRAKELVKKTFDKAIDSIANKAGEAIAQAIVDKFKKKKDDKKDDSANNTQTQTQTQTQTKSKKKKKKR